MFKGTFRYCEGNSHVTNKAECQNSTGRWENRIYNFDNLPQVINYVLSCNLYKVQLKWFVFHSEF